MKALSIRQPWAWLICAGVPVMESVDIGEGRTSVRYSGKAFIKDIENRSWGTDFRGRIYVHAGQRWDKDALDWLMEQGFAPMTCLMLYSARVPRGALVGEVDIVDCVTESKSLWFTGPYGLVLANSKVYAEPIPYKGRQGLFEVEL